MGTKVIVMRTTDLTISRSVIKIEIIFFIIIRDVNYLNSVP